MNEPLSENSRKVIDLAYNGSAESLFIKTLAIILEDVGKTPAEKALVERILSRLTAPVSPSELSSSEQDRLRTMQGLLLAAVAHREDPLRYQLEMKKH